MIISGVFGICGGVNEIIVPKTIEKFTEINLIIDEKKEADGESPLNVPVAVDEDGNTYSIPFSQLLNSLSEKLDYPDWYKLWATKIGLITIFLATLYFISGIMILLVKTYAIKLFYFTIATSVLWSAVRSVIYFQTESNYLIEYIPISLTSIVFDLVLLVFVITATKDAFIQNTEKVMSSEISADAKGTDDAMTANTKNKNIAALLAFFLGWIGIHKFYLGQVGWGIVYVLFFWTAVPVLISFIEFILLLTMSDKKFNQRFG